MESAAVHSYRKLVTSTPADCGFRMVAAAQGLKTKDATLAVRQYRHRLAPCAATDAAATEPQEVTAA
jgi:hypothetical protein